MSNHQITLRVNGKPVKLSVSSTETLAQVLRERLQLTGTKIGCEAGVCGSCAVLVNDKLTNSCLTLAALVDGASITTIEGLAQDEQLHPVQQAFVEHGAIQCGFCTPGMVMASLAILRSNSSPTEEEIREGIAGNICRCTGYTKIIRAVKAASEALQRL